MHNLIPCCAVCNGLKHDEDTYETPFIYPYKDSYGEQVTFEENGVNADNIESWLGAAREYEIKIRYADEIDGVLKSKIEHAATTFRLEELYSKHGDYVRDILRTAYIYNDDYFEGTKEYFAEFNKFSYKVDENAEPFEVMSEYESKFRSTGKSSTL